MTNAILTLSDITTSVDDEPRILDTRIGEALGMSRPRDIRKAITRNLEELSRYGEVARHGGAQVRANGSTHTIEEYYLNEGQALCLCALSDAPNAPDAREMLITVYMVWRKGADKIGVRAHTRRRALPPVLPPDLTPGEYYVRVRANGTARIVPMTGETLLLERSRYQVLWDAMKNLQPTAMM